MCRSPPRGESGKMPLRLDQVNFGLTSGFNCNVAIVADRSADVVVTSIGATDNDRQSFAASTPLITHQQVIKAVLQKAATTAMWSVTSIGCDSDLRFFNLDREDPVWRVSQDANRRSSDPMERLRPRTYMQRPTATCQG